MKSVYLVLIAGVCLAACTAPRMIIPKNVGPGAALPDQAMRELAMQIETAVAEGRRDHGIGDYEGIDVSDAAVQQAIRTRAARREVLDEFLDRGHAWERRDGLVYIIRSKEYKNEGNRRSRDRDAMIVISENEDRWTLYEGLIEANGYGSGSLKRIREIFTEARIDTLESGQKYENAAGDMVVK